MEKAGNIYNFRNECKQEMDPGIAQRVVDVNNVILVNYFNP